jgi:hypothetical protein
MASRWECRESGRRSCERPPLASAQPQRPRNRAITTTSLSKSMSVGALARLGGLLYLITIVMGL